MDSRVRGNDEHGLVTIMLTEINFDGIIGPSHNYAALSFGNLASTAHAGATSYPRAAALQGLAKMRTLLDLGLPQGFLLPPERPATEWLRALGFSGDDADAVAMAAYGADPRLFASAMSASSMWTANAATVSPAPDTTDGRCHLTTANLSRMPHRSLEAAATEAQLRVAFAHPSFAVHAAVPAAFGDEGAANHMRLCPAHDAPGVEVFVYGEDGGTFPARQSRRASEAVARRHGVDALFVQQSPEAIAAGAFHNDVVAVANSHVLFAHEQVFAGRDAFYAALQLRLPEVVVVEVPAAAVSLADAVASYLFNSQLVTLPGTGSDQGVAVPSRSMALILPREAASNIAVSRYLDTLLAGNGPIRAVHYIDVRESMQNGGGPACLRLRVVADRAAVDPRFLLDERKADKLAQIIEAHWPASIDSADLGRRELWQQCRAARWHLTQALDLSVLRNAA